MRALALSSRGPRPLRLALLLLASGCFSPTGKDPEGTTTASTTAVSTTTADTTTADPTPGTDAPTTGPAPTNSGPSNTTSTTAPDTTSTTAPPDTGTSTTATSDPSGTTTGTTGTTGTDTNCGDGVIQADEECDDGADNANNHICTPTCKHNICGDGLICPNCGQECDDGNTDNGDGCNSTCDFEFRYAFVTKAVFKGTLIGGVVGGDGICNQAAKPAPNLKGRSFRAWLSKNPDSAKQHLGADSLPVRRTDDKPLADNTPALSAGALKNPIDHDEFGLVVGAVAPCGSQNHVWTGTFADGTSDLDGVCSNWALVGVSGRVGNLSTADGTWTSCGTADCITEAHIYCIEVP